MLSRLKKVRFDSTIYVNEIRLVYYDKEQINNVFYTSSLLVYPSKIITLFLFLKGYLSLINLENSIIQKNVKCDSLVFLGKTVQKVSTLLKKYINQKFYLSY